MADSMEWRKDLSREALKLLGTYLKRWPHEASRLFGTIHLLEEDSRPFSRSNSKGHATATMCILSACGSNTLCIFHPYLRKWLPPGGHVEASAPSLRSSALAEALEEAGLSESFELAGFAGGLVDVDSHPIPANPKKGEPAHIHHDFLFACHAPEGFEPRPAPGDAVQLARWQPLSDWLGGSDARLDLAARKILSARG